MTITMKSKRRLAVLIAALMPAAGQAQPAAIGAVPPESTTPPQSTAAVPANIVPPASLRGAAANSPAYVPSYPGGADPAVTARAANLPITTLRDAILLAYWSNPTLLAQRDTLRSTDNRLPAARAAYGPNLSVQGTYGYQRDRVEVAPGTHAARGGFSSAASLVLNQPVFTFGRLRSAENGARAEIALARDSLRLTEADVMAGVVGAYVGVLRDAAGVTIAEENLKLLDRQYTDNKERFRVREITATDLQQVESRLENGYGQLLAARGQLGVSQSQFLRLVGAIPGELQAPNLLNIPFATLEEAYAFAETHSAVITAAHAREKISRAALEAAKAEYAPRVDLRGTGIYNGATPYSDNLRASQVRGEVVVGMPLFTSGAISARVREVQEANQADWRLIDGALRDMRQSVASAWDQLSSSRAALDNYRRAIDAAQKAYDGALLQEKAGARTTLDVLDLARDLLTIRTNYNITVSNEYIARASLLSAVGSLEAPMILPDIARYDPEAYFDRVKNRGDIPLLTPILSTLDSATVRGIKRDRPVRDPAAPLAIKESVILSGGDRPFAP